MLSVSLPRTSVDAMSAPSPHGRRLIRTIVLGGTAGLVCQLVPITAQLAAIVSLVVLPSQQASPLVPAVVGGLVLLGWAGLGAAIGSYLFAARSAARILSKLFSALGPPQARPLALALRWRAVRDERDVLVLYSAGAPLALRVACRACVQRDRQHLPQLGPPAAHSFAREPGQGAVRGRH